MIRLLILDWGGVLTAGEFDRHLAQLLAERKGLPEEEVYRVWRAGKRLALERGEGTVDEVWEELAARFGLRGSVEEFCVLLRSAVQYEPGVLELLRPLRTAAALALLSNNYPIVAAVARKSVAALFDHVFFSNETGLVKPAREAYLQVLEVAGVEPGEALFVDDKERNLVPAREIGMSTHLFTDPPAFRHAMVEHGLLVA